MLHTYIQLCFNAWVSQSKTLLDNLAAAAANSGMQLQYQTTIISVYLYHIKKTTESMAMSHLYLSLSLYSISFCVFFLFATSESLLLPRSLRVGETVRSFISSESSSVFPLRLCYFFVFQGFGGIFKGILGSIVCCGFMIFQCPCWPYRALPNSPPSIHGQLATSFHLSTLFCVLAFSTLQFLTL